MQKTREDSPRNGAAEIAASAMAPVTLKALPATSIVDPSSQSKRATIQVMPIASIQPMPGEAETCWTQEVQQTLQILDAVLGLGSYKRP